MRNIHRRKLLGLLAAPLALVLPKPVRAEPAWDGLLMVSQRTGLWLTVPSGRVQHVVVWPDDSDRFPPPPGWVSPDRTEIALLEPGAYRLDWRITFNPGGGSTRKTAAELWSPGDGWHALGDGNQVAPCRDGQETTLLGWAVCRSSGADRVRVLCYQDSGHELRTTDRGYEMSLAVSRVTALSRSA